MNKNCVDKNGCTEKLEFSLCSWCFSKPVSLQNVYILYGHNFNIGLNIEIMCVVSNSKSVHSYEQREQAIKTAVIQNISLRRHRMWMNEVMKMWKMFPVMKHSSVQNVFKLFITFHYFQSTTVCYSINKCLLWNVQILLTLKESENSLTKFQALRCGNIVLGWSAFRQKLGH